MEELGYIAYYAGFIVALLILFTWCSLKMSLAPTNWVIRLALNGIYLRYRSYLNGDYPGEPVAVFIPSGAIAWIRPVVKSSTQINSGGEKLSITQRRLEIKFRGSGLADLKQQIDHEHQRRIPARLGNKGVFRHYPVRVTANDAIQIDWRDAHMATTPGFKAAAAILVRHYPSCEAAYNERADAMDLVSGRGRRDHPGG